MSDSETIRKLGEALIKQDKSRLSTDEQDDFVEWFEGRKALFAYHFEHIKTARAKVEEQQKKLRRASKLLVSARETLIDLSSATAPGFGEIQVNLPEIEDRAHFMSQLATVAEKSRETADDFRMIPRQKNEYLLIVRGLAKELVEKYEELTGLLFTWASIKGDQDKLVPDSIGGQFVAEALRLALPEITDGNISTVLREFRATKRSSQS